MTYKNGDKVRITNGAWSNANSLQHYGKIATVRRASRNFVWLSVPLTSVTGSLMRSVTVVQKPLNEVEPYGVIDQLAALDG